MDSLMGRKNNNSVLSDVIDSRYEGASSRKRTSMDNAEQSKPGNNIKDPVRCPLCSAKLLCPRNKDYEEFIENKILRCTTSGDPICKAACSNPKNQDYIAKLKKRAHND